MKKLYILLFLLAPFFVQAQTNLIQDPSFELGPGNGAWIEFSTNFGTPYCDQASCGNCGGGCIPRTGTWYSWFGGITTLEVGSLEQSLTIPTAPAAELSFWLTIPTSAGNPADYLCVIIDNVDTLFNVTGVDTAAYVGGYAQVIMNMTPYANGASHTVTFSSTTDLAVTNFIIDDVDLHIINNPGYTEYQLLEGVSFFPNPANDNLYINFANTVSGSVSLEIYDMLGHRVSNEMFEGQGTQIKLDVSNLAPGTYMTKVLTADKMATNLIVIE